MAKKRNKIDESLEALKAERRESLLRASYHNSSVYSYDSLVIFRYVCIL
jgi:hypothetical protein